MGPPRNSWGESLQSLRQLAQLFLPSGIYEPLQDTTCSFNWDKFLLSTQNVQKERGENLRLPHPRILLPRSVLCRDNDHRIAHTIHHWQFFSSKWSFSQLSLRPFSRWKSCKRNRALYSHLKTKKNVNNSTSVIVKESVGRCVKNTIGERQRCLSLKKCLLVSFRQEHGKLNEIELQKRTETTIVFGSIS